MKRLTSMAFAAIAVFAVAILALQPVSVAAQSSAALSISPRKDYEAVDPGKTVNDTLVIRNLDNERTLNLSLRVVDFSYTDDGGTPNLMLAEDAPQTTWSLKPHLEVPDSVSIPPRESTTLDISVSIPEDMGGGSYYSAIVYSSGAPDGGNVGLSASGVTLVFAHVAGDTHQDLSLEKFGAYHEGTTNRKAGYLFATINKPEVMAYTLKNSGNVAEKPVGTIIIKDIFGRETTIRDVNPSGALALRGQSRTFMSCISLESGKTEFNGSTTEANRCVEPNLWPGYYRASLDLFYGQNGNITKEINGSASFWYLPIWFLMVVIILILAIALATWRITLKVRSRGQNNPTRAFRRK